MAASTLNDVTALDGSWELGAMLANTTGDGDAAQVWTVSVVDDGLVKSADLPAR